MPSLLRGMRQIKGCNNLEGLSSSPASYALHHPHQCLAIRCVRGRVRETWPPCTLQSVTCKSGLKEAVMKVLFGIIFAVVRIYLLLVIVNTISRPEQKAYVT